MEPVVRELGDRLARASRRSFLRTLTRGTLALGIGIAGVLGTGSRSSASVLKGAGDCPCAADPVWCSVCNGIDSNSGCPATYSVVYSWWCCLGGAEWKCVDCTAINGNCSCQYETPIAC